jgi:putative transposase
VLTSEHDHKSRWAAIKSVAAKIGCTPKILRSWMARMEVGSGARPGISSEEAARIKALERENRELRRANEILRLASAFFCPGGARPQTQEIVSFIDDHRHDFGVEPICQHLQIANGTYLGCS